MICVVYDIIEIPGWRGIRSQVPGSVECVPQVMPAETHRVGFCWKRRKRMTQLEGEISKLQKMMVRSYYTSFTY